MYNAIWFRHDYSLDLKRIIRNFIDRPTPERDENAKKNMEALREELKERKKLKIIRH